MKSGENGNRRGKVQKLAAIYVVSFQFQQQFKEKLVIIRCDFGQDIQVSFDTYKTELQTVQ